MSTQTDVIVIGAGQAGLAMSRSLTMRGIDHVVLERGRIGERWHSQRSPDLRLLTPNWMNRLPGMHEATDSKGFMRALDFATDLERYGRAFGAPIIEDCAVCSLTRDGGFYRVATAHGGFCAKAVVVATGACDQPSIPEWAKTLPSGIEQMDATRFRGPNSVQTGGVLVVGASSTGVQIAADLAGAGQSVAISVGRHVRATRRYRGRDLFEWLDLTGFLSAARPTGPTAAKLIRQPSLQLTGRGGGKAIGLDHLSAMGVQILARATGVSGNRIDLDDRLDAEITAGEARRQRVLHHIDDYIDAVGLQVPADIGAWCHPRIATRGARAIDLRAEGIRTVIWATGFRRSYPWLKLPVFDAAGELVTVGGKTRFPGLVALGLPFMRRRSSAFIHGVGQDAEDLAGHLADLFETQSLKAA